jgi:hypothetical protein
MKLSSLLYILTISILFAPSSQSAAKNKDHIITGRIISSIDCDFAPQVWISQNRQLIYQIEARIGSSFEAHLVPGEYQVNIATKDGCFHSEKIDLSQKENIHINANLMR